MSNVAFERVTDPPGLEIRDRVNKRQFTLHTPTGPVVKPADTDPFPFPVERACRFVTGGVRVPELTSVNVRDITGAQVAAPDHGTHEQLPADEYVVELDGQVKTYLLVTAPLDVTAGEDHAALSFGSPVDVVVGARARLRRPATTVTTTRDLDDVRRAVETLNSSLQTTSPERSFPTLRGHPPALELGDELAVPGAAEPPETGITLVVPRELSALFTVAPLSYYLGAGLAFGDHLRLETERGFEFDLDAPGVERVLQHVFLLDCLVRTHGLYRQKHQEYEALAPELPLDLPALYDATPVERTEAYLSVPTTTTEPYVPKWPSVAYVDPTVDRLEALPYLVDDLALIRADQINRYQGPQARSLALSRFVATAKSRGASAVFDGRDTFVDIPDSDARHQVWVGDGIPLNGAKFLTAGYEHQIQLEPTDRPNLSVMVVCNDDSMATEASTVETRYRSYTDRSLDIELHNQVTTTELASLLRDDADFFHFIGHATEAGLQCSDGWFDARTGVDVGFDSFLLNACQSYQQGCTFVEHGAVGGIVTLGDVPNDAAVETGGHLARLLNSGFTLRNALLIARWLSVVGGQYTLVGEGRTTLNQPTNAMADIARIESTADGYELWVDWFSDEVWRLGTQSSWKFPDGWQLHLPGGEKGPFELTAEQLLEYFELVSSPAWLDGEFHWSDDLTLDDFVE